MSEPAETNGAQGAENRLATAIREIKNAAADRDDVVVDIREAQRTRLELLAEDLQPVFDDIPDDDDRFDLAISAGAQPRLWIDSVSHVTMGRDRRTYRFLRDTRLGRVVLAESTDLRPVAEQVTRYIAERIIERRKILEGDVTSISLDTSAGAGAMQAADTTRKRGGGLLRAIGMVLLGGLVGVAITLAFAWERLAEIGLRF